MTEKGAKKLVMAFREEGVNCTVEWLLEGTGDMPRTLVDLFSSLSLKGKEADEEIFGDPIKVESKCFLNANANSRIFTMPDDSMEPAFIEGDTLGGILQEGEGIQMVIGKSCAVIDKNDAVHIRTLFAGEGGK